MPKKIVILNGSPRRKGNTSALVKAFTDGAESAGHTVTEFFLDGMSIHGCKRNCLATVRISYMLMGNIGAMMKSVS